MYKIYNQMKLKNIKPIDINLKTALTSKSLRDNLRKLLKKNVFINLDYITIQIIFQLFDINSKEYKSLGNKYVINLKNSSDINNYINYLIDKFDRDYITSYEPVDIVSIRCFYFPTKEIEYKNFKKRITHIRTFFDEVDTGIKSFLNIPFNVLYASWDNSTLINKTEYMINDINFNSEIESIKITQKQLKVYITIYFKNKDII